MLYVIDDEIEVVTVVAAQHRRDIYGIIESGRHAIVALTWALLSCRRR